MRAGLPVEVLPLCSLYFAFLTRRYIAKAKFSVDYCYFRKHHVKPVNRLLQQMFWDGIDGTCVLFAVDRQSTPTMQWPTVWTTRNSPSLLSIAAS